MRGSKQSTENFLVGVAVGIGATLVFGSAVNTDKLLDIIVEVSNGRK